MVVGVFGIIICCLRWGRVFNCEQIQERELTSWDPLRPEPQHPRVAWRCICSGEPSASSRTPPARTLKSPFAPYWWLALIPSLIIYLRRRRLANQSTNQRNRRTRRHLSACCERFCTPSPLITPATIKSFLPRTSLATLPRRRPSSALTKPCVAYDPIKYFSVSQRAVYRFSN